MPHIRLLDPEHGSTSLANLFGLPYVIEAKSRPFDRTTLHNNWQKNGTEAFSLYTGMTGKIDDELAAQAVSSILRFLTRMGIIRYYSHSGYIASVLKEGDLERRHFYKESRMWSGSQQRRCFGADYEGR